VFDTLSHVSGIWNAFLWRVELRGTNIAKTVIFHICQNLYLVSPRFLIFECDLIKTSFISIKGTKIYKPRSAMHAKMIFWNVFLQFKIEFDHCEMAYAKLNRFFIMINIFFQFHAVNLFPICEDFKFKIIVCIWIEILISLWTKQWFERNSGKLVATS